MNMKYLINLILVVSVFMFASCKSHKTDSNAEAQTFVLSDTMLKSTTFSRANIENVKNELEFYGKIAADNNKLIEIYPMVGGSVMKVFVELGDHVEKGQLLATIRSTEVASFEKDLNDAKNDVVVAKNNLKAVQELYEGKLNTERDVITAKSELDKAQSQLGRVQETYKIYSLKAGAIYEVRSPISGFILQKDINQDMLLRSDHSNNIFDIADINEVWALANVSESDIQEVGLGFDACVTTMSYPDKVFHGKIDKIFNVIDPETKAMTVRIKLQNPEYLLKPEMKTSVKISYKEKEQMITVPSSAVIFDKSQYYVMVYKDRFNIETRKVDVFRQLSDITFIKSGIKVGDSVITHNQLLIYDALND